MGPFRVFYFGWAIGISVIRFKHYHFSPILLFPNLASSTMPSIVLGAPVQPRTADIAIILRLPAKQVIKLIRHIIEWVRTAASWSNILIATPAKPLIVLWNPLHGRSAMWAWRHILLICHDLSPIFCMILSLINICLQAGSQSNLQLSQ